MLLLAFWATRNIALAPLIGLPVVARCVAVDGDRRGVRFPRAIVSFTCGLVVLIVAMLAVGTATEDAFAVRSYPVAAMRYVDHHGLLGRRIFTDDADAGYVILRYWPEQRVFMDDRYDMFPTDVIWNFFDVARGGHEWAKILDARHVEVVVWLKDEPLASLLDQSADWQRVHTDGRFAVWVRADR